MKEHSKKKKNQLLNYSVEHDQAEEEYGIWTQ